MRRTSPGNDALADEARAYLDDLIRRRDGDLRIRAVEGVGGYHATVMLRAPIIGYTVFAWTQAEAVLGLARGIQVDREGVR